MTIKEFEEAAEIWYSRTHRLREYMEDESKPLLKRAKALLLFNRMVKIMMNVTQVYIKLAIPKLNKYQKGSV